MKKEQVEQETRGKCAYAPPKIEFYAAESGKLLGTSFIGEAGAGLNTSNDFSEHERGKDGGVVYDAKAVILGQEFSFSDVWEE